MKRILAMTLGMLFGTMAGAQYAPPPSAAFTYSGSSWIAAATTATAGAINYTPPAAALYCYNSTLGKWVPADSSCFGGGGGGTIGGTVSDKSIPMGTAADTLGNSPMSVDNSASPTKITSTVPLSSKGFFPGSVTVRPYSVYFDDFYVAVNGTTMGSGAIGSPSGQSCSGSSSASTAAHPGILVLTSGTGGTGTGITCNTPPGANQIAALATNTTPFTLEFGLNVPVLPGTTVGAYQVGITRTIGINPWPTGAAASFYLSSANAVANDWYCNAGATAGLVDSGVAATTGWAAGDLTNDGAKIHFYINGTEVCGTGIPIAQFSGMTSAGSIGATVVALSGTSVVMNLDYVLFKYEVTRN